jgi:SAM-dependent methyltransferase
LTLTVQEQFGQIDIYVFDQILRGNIAPGMRVLDAGCGYGRNLVHLLRSGCEVFAVDADPEGVAHVRQLSASLQTGLPQENFGVARIEEMPFPRVLRPGGMLFCRLGSRIGMDFEQVRPGIFLVGDGSEWFLVNEPMLLSLTRQMNAVLVDPLKTTIVQDYRCMTTWVTRKRRD